MNEVNEIIGKSKLWRLLSFLSWTEGVLGLGMMAMAISPLQNITSLIPNNIDFRIIYLTVFLGGLAITIVSLMGVVISQASLTNPYLATKKTYTIWLILAGFLIILLAACGIIIAKTLSTAEKEAINELNRGMRNYLHDSNWKSAWDNIQQEYKCCGVESYEDWFTINWIPSYLIQKGLHTRRGQALDFDGTFKTGILPFSCCKTNILAPCLHDANQQNDSSASWLSSDLPYQPTIYTRGCKEAFIKPLVKCFRPFRFILAAVIIFQIGQLMIGRYLQSTFRKLRRINISNSQNMKDRAKGNNSLN